MRGDGVIFVCGFVWCFCGGGKGMVKGGGLG